MRNTLLKLVKSQINNIDFSDGPCVLIVAGTRGKQSLVKIKKEKNRIKVTLGKYIKRTYKYYYDEIFSD